MGGISKQGENVTPGGIIPRKSSPRDDFLENPPPGGKDFQGGGFCGTPVCLKG